MTLIALLVSLSLATLATLSLALRPYLAAPVGWPTVDATAYPVYLVGIEAYQPAPSRLRPRLAPRFPRLGYVVGQDAWTGAAWRPGTPALECYACGGGVEPGEACYYCTQTECLSCGRDLAECSGAIGVCPGNPADEPTYTPGYVPTPEEIDAFLLACMADMRNRATA